MRFWIRETLGWVLVGLGLFDFYMCVVLLFNHSVIEVGPMFVIGIVVFRGGIHLLKVAVAARICMQAQAKIEGSSTAAPKASSQARVFRPMLARSTMPKDIRKSR
jgi:hypothetical protein